MYYKERAMMLADLYEFTTANMYLSDDMIGKEAYFDVFFRKIPDKGGFAILAGLEQVIGYLCDLSFSDEDIEYLKSIGCGERTIDYIKNFKFECDVWAVPEGTPIFPNEPVLTVKGPVVQAQMIETAILMMINYQSLIATKANKIVRAAQGRQVIEFGARRAHGYDAAVCGARAAYIGGCDGTTNATANRLFGVPCFSTMPHSWVQMFDSEYEAFRTFAKEHPDSCGFVVDTYNVLESGIPNAIRVFNEIVVPMGYRPKSVRIDSGDLSYLSKKIRPMLDAAGFSDCNIEFSNSIDEYIIRDMLLQGAKVDTFYVGERLITASTDPVFGGVYKLAALESDGVIEPKIKITENPGKITIPCFKELWRLFDRETGKAIADLISEAGDSIDDTSAYEIFDPVHTWKKKMIYDFIARPLMCRIFERGKMVYDTPPLKEIRRYASEQIDMLWEEVKRFENPHTYYVDLDRKLWEKRQALVKKQLSV